MQYRLCEVWGELRLPVVSITNGGLGPFTQGVLLGDAFLQWAECLPINCPWMRVFAGNCKAMAMHFFAVFLFYLVMSFDVNIGCDVINRLCR